MQPIYKCGSVGKTQCLFLNPLLSFNLKQTGRIIITQQNLFPMKVDTSVSILLLKNKACKECLGEIYIFLLIKFLQAV